VPEAVHACERCIVRGEEVGSVGKYREEEAVGNAVAEEGSDACSWGGVAFDEGEDGLGQREPVPVVVCGVFKSHAPRVPLYRGSSLNPSPA